MLDLNEWSASRSEWADLRAELDKQQIRLNARSNGSFDAFLRQQPEPVRKRWQDFFAAYLADHLSESLPTTSFLTKGQKDRIGRTVRRIHVETDEFVIYCADDKDDSDDSCTLCYTFKPGVRPDREREMRAGLCPIAAQIYRLADCVEGMRSVFDRARQRRERDRAFELMARAMSFGLEGHKDQAEAILDVLEDEILLRRDSKNRMRYILATTMSFIMVAAGGLYLKSMDPDWLKAGIGVDPNKTLIIDVLLFGALGAFFAVAYDIKSVKVHHAITIPEMFYAGAVRIPVGVIAAAVIILLVTGQWMLGGLNEEQISWSLLLVGFLAGFSEMFVPNALKQTEKQLSVARPAKGPNAAAAARR